MGGGREHWLFLRARREIDVLAALVSVEQSRATRCTNGIWNVFLRPHCCFHVVVVLFDTEEVIYFIVILSTLLSLPESSGSLTWVRLQQPQEQRCIPSPTSACWVSSCFRNPPNSDMDYRIGSLRSVCDHSYASVYTRGLDTPTTSQHNSFKHENMRLHVKI